MKSLYKLTLLLLFIPAIAFSSNETDKKKHEKSKSINKSFDVNSNATLSINNKYGDVNVTTWNKNTIQIDIKITVKGNDLDDVEEQLEKINVEFNASKSLVEAKTLFRRKNNWGFWNKNKKMSYEIDYTVKMPITNNANLSNDYGNISLNELEGEANINCDYGKIHIGDLKGKNSQINLDYCSSSTVNSMKDGSINVDYSKLTIENAETVKLNTDYSTIKLKKLDQLTFNADYGGVEVEQAASVSGNGDYSSLKFGTITKSLKLKSDYGSIRIKNLEKGFDFVDIDSEYAGIRIGISPNNNFNFVVDLQYAGFKRNNSKIEMYERIVKNTKKYYRGVYGKGKSDSKVTIRSEFGSVSFNEN